MPASSLARCVQPILSAHLTPDAEVLLAISGGLDSIALGEILLELAPSLSLTLVVAHVDHNLRASSRRDADRAREFARRHGLAYSEHVLIQNDALKKDQSTLRRRRYAALGNIALTRGIDTIITAHHADDRIEDFLLKARRGTSLRGLSSFEALSSYPIPSPLRLLRPLLGLGKAELRAYLTDRHVHWTEDPTNSHKTYARNQLRHEVLPAYLSGQAQRRGLLRTIETITSENILLDKLASDLLDEARCPLKALRRQFFRRSPFIDAPLPLRRRALLHLIPTLHARHLEAFDAALDGEPPVYLTFPSHRIEIDEVFFIIEPYDLRGAHDLFHRTYEPIKIAPETDDELYFVGHRLHWVVNPPISPRSPPFWQSAPALTTFRIARPPSDVFLFFGPLASRKPFVDDFRRHTIPLSYRNDWPALHDHTGQPLWIPGVWSSAPSSEAIDTPAECIRFTWSPPIEIAEIIHK